MEQQASGRRTILRTGAAMLGSLSLLPVLPGFAKANTYIVPMLWNTAALAAIEESGPGVTIVARALAIVHTCMFDAWSAYDAVAIGTALGIQLRRPPIEYTRANKEKAISYAAYHALLDLFPNQQQNFRALMQRLGYDPQNTSTDATDPAGIGNIAANAVLQLRHHDGSNQLGDLHTDAYSDYTGYQPDNTADVCSNPNHWQPLRVLTHSGGSIIQKYVTPHWARVTPFALHRGSQFRPALAPATINEPRYTAQANTLLNLSAYLTDEQKVIAEYWMDTTGTVQPPGHWCMITQYVLKRDRYDLDNAVKLFFIVTNGLLDASIACWDTRLAYNAERPITAIRYLYAGRKVQAWAGPGQGTQLIDGASWQPYQPLTIVTPAFPEYCSGHSTFSATSSVLLNLYTRSDYFGGSHIYKAGSSLIEPGLTPHNDVTLFWPTFSAAAVEAGISRRYGGIHFEQGDLIGRLLGRAVAAMVWSKALRYIHGTL